jgi:hypothetical protein
MGEQLALDRPNHALLTRLSSEIVAEGARLERIEQKRLLRIAFQLSVADRKTLGRFMVRAAPDNLPGAKAILQQVP